MKEDCVSREAVIDLMRTNWADHDGDTSMQLSIDDVRELPSITPERMTIRDLLRVTDYNGDDEELLFKIMDGNGNVRVIFHTNCDLLWELGDKVINSINVAHAKVLEIWLEDEKNE